MRQGRFRLLSLATVAQDGHPLVLCWLRRPICVGRPSGSRLGRAIRRMCCIDQLNRQLEVDVRVRGERQALFRDHRAADVAP